MDKKVENTFKINKGIEKANISNEGYNSMDVGFFARMANKNYSDRFQRDQTTTKRIKL